MGHGQNHDGNMKMTEIWHLRNLVLLWWQIRQRYLWGFLLGWPRREGWHWCCGDPWIHDRRWHHCPKSQGWGRYGNVCSLEFSLRQTLNGPMGMGARVGITTQVSEGSLWPPTMGPFLDICLKGQHGSCPTGIHSLGKGRPCPGLC